MDDGWDGVRIQTQEQQMQRSRRRKADSIERDALLIRSVCCISRHYFYLSPLNREKRKRSLSTTMKEGSIENNCNHQQLCGLAPLVPS